VSADAFFTRLNPLISPLLRSPLHWPLSTSLVLVTVTGRRTGRRYTFPVGYQRDGETLTVMVSEARRKAWWRNFREPGEVELRLRGRERSGRAVIVAPGSDEFHERIEHTLQRMPWLGRVFGIQYDARRGLSEEQLAHLGEENAMVRIDLDSQTS